VSISQAFYLAASLNHMTSRDPRAAETLRTYATEHPENQKVASYIKERLDAPGSRPV
jgi:hypothetical protein